MSARVVKTQAELDAALADKAVDWIEIRSERGVWLTVTAYDSATVNDKCGNGLHFSPSPTQALAYDLDATRFLAVGVDIATLRPLDGGTAKCKAPAVVRACVEVDIDGNEVTR